MRKICIIIILSVIFFQLIIQCTKDKPINIVLWDKPLETIQHYIHGKWRLVYGKGGICGSCVSPCDNCIVEFTSDNRFISKSFVITSDTTTIRWIWEKGSYLGGDSTFVMTFYDKNGAPGSFIIKQIIDDVLIYYDNSSDPMFYHCIRIK